MTKTIFIVPIAPRHGALSCVWIETGSPAQPLACIWVDRDSRMIADCEESEIEPCRLCA